MLTPNLDRDFEPSVLKAALDHLQRAGSTGAA